MEIFKNDGDNGSTTTATSIVAAENEATVTEFKHETEETDRDPSSKSNPDAASNGAADANEPAKQETAKEDGSAAPEASRQGGNKKRKHGNGRNQGRGAWDKNTRKKPNPEPNEKEDGEKAVPDNDKEGEGNESKIPKRRVAVLFGYCGTGYQGMQMNPNAASIELELHKAFAASGVVSEDNAMDPNKCDSRLYEYVCPTYVFSSSVDFRRKDDTDVRLGFRIDADTLEKVRSFLKAYVGSFNFHNYTVDVVYKSSSAKRYIMSFEAHEPFVVDDIEWKFGTKSNEAGRTDIDFAEHKDVMEPFIKEWIYSKIFEEEKRDFVFLKWLGYVYSHIEDFTWWLNPEGVIYEDKKPAWGGKEPDD
ncbi:tRNA pseudouridine synthase 1 [Phlyctochytrium bullatum]|nr:tRNA pseudouridine synthase 1 [Phlyctochytrium bullatum]